MNPRAWLSMCQAVSDVVAAQVHDFEYRMERKEKERQELQEEIVSLRERSDTLQLDCDRYEHLLLQR